MRLPYRRLLLSSLFVALLSACGNKVTTTTTSDVAHPSAVEASRFLSQASFGPTPEDINHVVDVGIGAWLNEQFAKPQHYHFMYMNQAMRKLPANQDLGDDPFFESFWQEAVNGEDQLRQRVAFALSEILVVSYQNSSLYYNARGTANYYDLLAYHAFGNYRDLLQAVSLHPMMGEYLNARGNQKTNGTQVPNENYAREIMQLFSIGLRQLNVDGTDTTTPATPTYTIDDIKGLAKVFTGWSWAGPDKSNARFNGWNNQQDENRDWLPMQNYPQFHETLPKTFLGVTIPANTSGEASLKIAIDTLFNHPNVGPFIGKRLIQRLVTSNPSPAYVGRVAAAFNNNGKGVRGDMKAVILAILLDPEARAVPTSVNAGKLREPVLRLANWARAFHAKSVSGLYQMGNLDDPLWALAQTPMRSPSVFNFFKPEYVPPGTNVAAAGLLSPEMQITDEVSVTGYLNFMRDAINNGTGISNDVYSDYTSELALADNPTELVNRVNLLLLQGQMSDALRAQILSAINLNPSNSKINRVRLAIFLTMASPEYIVQK